MQALLGKHITHNTHTPNKYTHGAEQQTVATVGLSQKNIGKVWGGEMTDDGAVGSTAGDLYWGKQFSLQMVGEVDLSHIVLPLLPLLRSPPPIRIQLWMGCR